MYGVPNWFGTDDFQARYDELAQKYQKGEATHDDMVDLIDLSDFPKVNACIDVDELFKRAFGTE